MRHDHGGNRASAVVVLLTVVLAVACTGCPPPDAAEPLGEELPRDELLREFNARARRLDRLRTDCRITLRYPKTDDRGESIPEKYEQHGADGDLLFRKPRDLYLVGRVLGSELFGLHSNSGEYWFWIKPEVSTEYYGRYGGPAARGFALRPDRLLLALGIFELQRDDGAMFVRGDTFDRIYRFRALPGAGDPAGPGVSHYVEEQIVLERVHHDPVEVRLYDPEGERLVVSELSDYREVEGVRVPHRIHLRFVPEDATMTLELKRGDVELPAELNDRIFAYREPPVDRHVDLDAQALEAPPLTSAE